MAAVLAASSLYGLYAAESEEIVAQVFGDRVYCYLLVPPFIWTISTIDGSTKKPSFIRMKSRNQYLLFLLLQQYLFAVIYLTTWFSMIYILAIWHGERYLFVDMFSSYIRYLLSFFLLANISEMLKRTKNKMLSTMPFISAYLLLLMQIFISVIRKAFCACGCCCPFWLWDFACCGQLKRISATEINETERVRFTPLKDGRGKSL